MAAPGTRGEVRVRLMFEYPPPALPHSRTLWFLLDAERCRAVTDISALIRDRFFYNRQGTLGLYLDGSLLPPGESARLIRDNDSISVRWEDIQPHDGPHRATNKRQRPEDGAPEEMVEEVIERLKKKKKKEVVTPAEEEVSKRPKKKKKMTPAEEEVRERVKVTQEEELVSKQQKKKVTPAEEVVSKRPKKNRVTSEEEVVSKPLKKKKMVTPAEEVVIKRPKKKNKMTPVEEEVSERPKVTQEEVSDRFKKARAPQQYREASERKPKNYDLSKAQFQETSPPPVVSVPEKSPPPVVSVPEKSPPPVGSVPEKSPPPVGSVQKSPPPVGSRVGSSTSSEQEDTGAPPVTPSISKMPLMSGPAVSPPVCNGRGARGGGQHKPPLRTAGRGVGWGPDIDRPPLRGWGIHGQGQAQPEKHFFYDYDQETLKEQQLNEDVSNVSVLIQNPPEVNTTDYSALPLLAAPPPPGRLIAFKLLELTENYTPEVSDYKEGRVLTYDPITQQLEVELLSQQKKKEPGKFDLVYEGEDGTAVVEYAVPQESKITQAWTSLIEPRLVTEHGP